MRPVPKIHTIFGRFALIWCYFQNICVCHFWDHWGQRMIEVEFWGCDLKILQSFLKVWLPISKKWDRPLYDKQFQSSDLFVFFYCSSKYWKFLVSIAKRKISILYFTVASCHKIKSVFRVLKYITLLMTWHSVFIYLTSPHEWKIIYEGTQNDRIRHQIYTYQVL